jgi:hypothetical protein
MPLAVRNDLAHVINVVLLVLAGVLLGVLLQDGDNLAAAIVPDSFTGAIVLGPVGSKYNCKDTKSKLWYTIQRQQILLDQASLVAPLRTY